jgi:hypothetical protein
MGLISQGLKAAAVAIGLSLLLAWPVQSQSIEEAALRLSLMLSREVACTATDPVFAIAAVPAEDESQTLDAQVMARIEGVVLDALRRETLDCVRITEVTRAFDTLAFVQNLGRWGTLGAEQRNRVASELADADATATILLNRSGDAYIASLGLVELASGRMLASARAEIPETLTATGCGTAAAAEARGLETLAASLVTRLQGAQVLHVAPATYQDSFDPLGYGRYIADQFIAALSAQEGDVITGRRMTVRRLDVVGGVTLGGEDHEIALRYWPCEDLSAVRLTVVASSGQGNVVTLSQDLSLATLPAGLAVVPEVTVTAQNNAPSPEPDLGLISVEPRLIRIGELLTISAEPPSECNPFFFDVSASGRMTPIPIEIFDTTEIRPGLMRYDNNAASQYGIIVQPEDEPGIHRLGFICQPTGLTQDGVRNVLRQLRREHAGSAAGVIQSEAWDVVFNTMAYEILR